MSFSSKNNEIIRKHMSKDELFLLKTEKRESSLEKPRNAINLKSRFYEKEPEKKFNKNLVILNYITNTSERKYSIKTSLTSSVPEKLDYDLGMLNKHDENLDTSLSFISDFDLEADYNNQDESFDSCIDDNSVEQVEIKTRTKNIVSDNNDNSDSDIELEKEWFSIKEFLLNKN